MIRSDYLHYFLTVAKHNSINSAALELNVTPPAVSHAIKKFEDELNLTLFTRSPRGAFLTPAGEAILPLAKEVVSALNQMEFTARDLAEQNTLAQFNIPSCVFFSESSIFEQYLSAISKQLYIKFPHTDFLIADKPLKNVLQTINEDIYSFALLLIGNDIQKNITQNYPNISQNIIYSYHPALLANKNSKWLKIAKNAKNLSMQEIISLPLITVAWNSSSNYSFNNLLKAYDTPNIINVAPNLSVLKSFLENDIGIALGIENQFALSKNTISIPLETEPQLIFSYVVLLNKNLPSHLANTITQIIKDSFQNLI